MASPQKENGFTSIANELLGQILKSDFTLRELKIILTVIRFSYGFNRKQAELSVRFISEATGIKYHHISNSINTLIRKYVLTVNNSDNHKQGRVLKLNKDYETWNFDSYQKGNSYQKSNGSVTEKVTETVTEKVTKKENNKENINKRVSDLFDCWNEKNIIKHRKLTDSIKRKINSSLKDYSLEEIKTSIDNYTLILSSDDYYWTHKWTLIEFLQRGLEKFLDFNVAAENFRNKSLISNNGHKPAEQGNQKMEFV